MRKILVIILLNLLNYISLYCELNYRWIIAEPSLRLRNEAKLSAKQIDSIPYGNRVILLEETGKEIIISGNIGKWSKVKWKGKTGWVFGGFLTNNIESLKDFELFINNESWITCELRGKDKNNFKNYVYLGDKKFGFINYYQPHDLVIEIYPLGNAPDYFIIESYKLLNENQYEIIYNNYKKKEISKLIITKNNNLLFIEDSIDYYTGVYIKSAEEDKFKKVIDDEKIEIKKSNLIGKWEIGRYIIIELKDDGTFLLDDSKEPHYRRPERIKIGSWDLEKNNLIIEKFDDRYFRITDLCKDYFIAFCSAGKFGELKERYNRVK